MKTNGFCFTAGFWTKAFCALNLALLFSLPVAAADRDSRHDGGRSSVGRDDGRRSTPSHVETQTRPTIVDRSNHGSVRHSESHIIGPAEANRPRIETQRRDTGHHDNDRHDDNRHETIIRHENITRRDVHVHHDVDVDIHRPHHWNNFVFGRRFSRLPGPFLSLRIGGLSFFYDDGIYYQPVDGGYQEVYPPVGAIIPQPPEGSIEIYAGGQTYYYAGGGFYVQQPDGSFVLAPTPIGVIVPELPPGAIQVYVNGRVAFQFNGIYYQPVFVNGITQYQTFLP